MRRHDRARFASPGSIGAAFLDGLLPDLGLFHLAARRQSLIAQHAQHLHFRPLAAARAVFDDLHIPRAALAVFIRLGNLFRLRPPQHQQLANVLHASGVQLIAQLCKQGLADGGLFKWREVAQIVVEFALGTVDAVDRHIIELIFKGDLHGDQ